MSGFFRIILKLLVCFQVFMAKVLNHMMPSLTLGSIESKWVSRDKKQVRQMLPELFYTLMRQFHPEPLSAMFVKSCTTGLHPDRDRFLSSQQCVLCGPYIFEI